MLVDEIVEAVVDIVQDGEYGDPEVLAILDQVALAVGVLVRIPSAKKIGTVTISASETSTNVRSTYPNFMPHYVKQAYNTTVGEFVKVYDSLELLFEDYPTFTEEGNIEAIALEDFMLWTQKVAAEDQNISFIYYDRPSIPSDSSTITWIPEGLHRDIFVCGAAALVFGELEDGLESATDGGKPNTGHYAANYYRGIKNYKQYMATFTKHNLSSFWSE